MLRHSKVILESIISNEKYFSQVSVGFDYESIEEIENVFKSIWIKERFENGKQFNLDKIKLILKHISNGGLSTNQLPLSTFVMFCKFLVQTRSSFIVRR